MTVSLTLPEDVERRLLAEISSGRHASLEEAIIEKVSRADDADLLVITGRDPAWFRNDLNQAWTDREGAVDGNTFFQHLAARSESLKPQGK